MKFRHWHFSPPLLFQSEKNDFVIHKKKAFIASFTPASNYEPKDQLEISPFDKNHNIFQQDVAMIGLALKWLKDVLTKMH